MTAASDGGSKIERAIRASTTAGRPALAAFLTAGFPDRDGFSQLLDDVASESDVVEVGVPFTDPMADGVTIQQSSHRALENGVTLPWILETVGRSPRAVPVLLMSYLNPILAYGLADFGRNAASAGVSGLIVPDLPYEECHAVRETLDEAGVALVQLVTPVTPAERLLAVCAVSRGFVYAVTMTGTTGGAADRGPSMLEYLDRVRDAAPVPVLAGFGIRSIDQVRTVADHADGVIVGSALIEVLQRGEDPISFLRQLRATDQSEANA